MRTLAGPRAGRAILGCLLLVLPSHALAWGGQGHRIVVQLAMRQLTRASTSSPEARRARSLVYRLVSDGHTTVEEGAVWPDVVRKSAPYRYAQNWHFVSIPRSESAYDAAKQCVQKPLAPEGDCAVGGLAHFRKVLLDPEHKDDHLDAVRFIIHIVGDLHQPLHTSEDLGFTANGHPGDRGGNYRHVCFLRVSRNACSEVYDGERQPKNLHATWDKYMIIATGVAEHAYIDELDGRIAALSTAALGQLQSGGPAEWAEESHKVAVEAAYTPGLVGDLHFPHDHRYDDYFFVGSSYQKKNIERVDTQLTKAGVRLAAYLEQIARDMP